VALLVFSPLWISFFLFVFLAPHLFCVCVCVAFVFYLYNLIVRSLRTGTLGFASPDFSTELALKNQRV